MLPDRTEVTVFTGYFMGNDRDKEAYVDSLVISLSRLGYAPYFDEDGNVCFVVSDGEALTSINNTVIENKIKDSIL